MQTLTETTEINIFLHPDILGVMWPADARAFSLLNSRKGPGIEVGKKSGRLPRASSPAEKKNGLNAVYRSVH